MLWIALPIGAGLAITRVGIRIVQTSGTGSIQHPLPNVMGITWIVSGNGRERPRPAESVHGEAISPTDARVRRNIRAAHQPGSIDAVPAIGIYLPIRPCGAQVETPIDHFVSV